jgi:hypothetical protein
MAEDVRVERKQTPCTACGGTEVVVGFLAPWELSFKPRGASRLSMGEAVEAHKCSQCGLVQMFARRKAWAT